METIGNSRNRLKVQQVFIPSFLVKSKTEDSVKCEVVDGGELKSRRHLNVQGKSATLPSITG